MLQGSNMIHELGHICLQPLHSRTGLAVLLACIFSFSATMIRSDGSSFHSVISLPVDGTVNISITTIVTGLPANGRYLLSMS